MWLANRLVLPLMAQCSGNESRVAEWLASQPHHSPLISFIQFLTIAALLSWMQEIRRPGMFRLSLVLSPLAGLGLLDLRSTTPSHLHGVLTAFALARILGVASAATLMYLMKKRLTPKQYAV